MRWIKRERGQAPAPSRMRPAASGWLLAALLASFERFGSPYDLTAAVPSPGQPAAAAAAPGEQQQPKAGSIIIPLRGGTRHWGGAGHRGSAAAARKYHRALFERVQQQRPAGKPMGKPVGGLTASSGRRAAAVPPTPLRRD